MNKKEERDNFWISVGPESGYLGTIAEETARKNDGGISPDGQRLGWQNTWDDDYGNGVADGWDADDIATEYPYGDPCDRAENSTCGDDGKGGCKCGDDCDYGNGRKDGCDCGVGCDCTPCCGDDERHTAYPCCEGGEGKPQDSSASGGVTAGYVPIFGADCACNTIPLPGMIPVEQFNAVPPADLGPERQNTCD